MAKYLDNTGLTYLWAKIKARYVPLTRKVNGKSLSTDITLTASDVGASASNHNHNDIYSSVEIVRW